MKIVRFIPGFFETEAANWFPHGPKSLPAIANADGGSGVEEILATKSASVQSLYLRLLSGEFLSQARRVRENNRVYNTPVVMLLMIIQRLRTGGSLESVVLELPDLPASLWPGPCGRLLADAPAMSSHTGAYSKELRKLPLQTVEEFSDNVFARSRLGTTAGAIGALPANGPPGVCV